MNTLSTSKQKLSLAFKIIKDTVQGFVDDNVMRLSASLAYATLFSIIPLFSLLITIGVFLQIDLTDQLYTQIEPVVGPKVVEALRSIIENATEADVSSFATIISVGVTIFSATTVFAEIQSSLNDGSLHSDSLFRVRWQALFYRHISPSDEQIRKGNHPSGPTPSSML